MGQNKNKNRLRCYFLAVTLDTNLNNR